MFSSLSRAAVSAALMLSAYSAPANAHIHVVPDNNFPVVGKKFQVGWADQINSDCSVTVIPSVKILVAPKHGHLSTAQSKLHPRYARPDPLAHCDKRQVDGLKLYYQPDDGFVGHDHMEYRMIFIHDVAAGTRVDVDISEILGRRRVYLKRTVERH